MPSLPPELAPAKIIDAFLIAKSIQAILSFSVGSQNHWTILTISFSWHLPYLSQKQTTGCHLCSLSMAPFFPTHSSILDSMKVQLSTLLSSPSTHCPEGRAIYSPRFSLCKTNVTIIGSSIWLVWFILSLGLLHQLLLQCASIILSASAFQNCNHPLHSISKALLTVFP